MITLKQRCSAAIILAASLSSPFAYANGQAEECFEMKPGKYARAGNFNQLDKVDGFYSYCLSSGNLSIEFENIYGEVSSIQPADGSQLQGHSIVMINNSQLLAEFVLKSENGSFLESYILHPESGQLVTKKALTAEIARNTGNPDLKFADMRAINETMVVFVDQSIEAVFSPFSINPMQFTIEADFLGEDTKANLEGAVLAEHPNQDVLILQYWDPASSSFKLAATELRAAMSGNQSWSQLMDFGAGDRSDDYYNDKVVWTGTHYVYAVFLNGETTFVGVDGSLNLAWQETLPSRVLNMTEAGASVLTSTGYPLNDTQNQAGFVAFNNSPNGSPLQYIKLDGSSCQAILVEDNIYCGAGQDSISLVSLFESTGEIPAVNQNGVYDLSSLNEDFDPTAVTINDDGSVTVAGDGSSTVNNRRSGGGTMGWGVLFMLSLPATLLSQRRKWRVYLASN